MTPSLLRSFGSPFVGKKLKMPFLGGRTTKTDGNVALENEGKIAIEVFFALGRGETWGGAKIASCALRPPPWRPASPPPKDVVGTFWWGWTDGSNKQNDRGGEERTGQ